MDQDQQPKTPGERAPLKRSRGRPPKGTSRSEQSILSRAKRLSSSAVRIELIVLITLNEAILKAAQNHPDGRTGWLIDLAQKELKQLHLL